MRLVVSQLFEETFEVTTAEGEEDEEEEEEKEEKEEVDWEQYGEEVEEEEKEEEEKEEVDWEQYEEEVEEEEEEEEKRRRRRRRTDALHMHPQVDPQAKLATGTSCWLDSFLLVPAYLSSCFSTTHCCPVPAPS